MSGVGWNKIWELVLKLVAQQPPAVEIAIVLAAAFSALMFVEGLRYNFVPRRKPKPHAPPREASPSSETRTFRSMRPGARLRLDVPRRPKRLETMVSRHSAPRPKIHHFGAPLRVVPAGDSASPQEQTAAPRNENLPQVASFED